MRITLGPKEKRERRIGERLGVKGERCDSPKCAAVRRNYPPGVHGGAGKVRRGPRLSAFGIQLREKQKAQIIYGLAERQFGNYVRDATRRRGDTSLMLGQLLEQRLDNVVFRLGFARSRGEARQKVAHGHFMINGKKVSIPSYQIHVGETVAVLPKSAKSPFFEDSIIPQLDRRDVPKWLAREKGDLSGRIIAIPDHDDLPNNVDRKMIIEFYSR